MHTALTAIKVCLKDKIFITSGRAGRAEFWWFTLFALLVRLVLLPMNYIAALGAIYAIINFIVFIANYTAALRRLHDSNRAGLHFVPLFVGLLLIPAGLFLSLPLAVKAGEAIAGLGMLYVLVLCALPGTKGSNLYGDPCPLPATGK